jgi:hypothetical protein
MGMKSKEVDKYINKFDIEKKKILKNFDCVLLQKSGIEERNIVEI